MKSVARKPILLFLLFLLLIPPSFNVCASCILQVSAKIVSNSFRTQSSITVEITSPNSGGIVSSTVNVSAEAQSSDGVARVEFYIDGQLKFNDSESPYRWTWDTEQYSEKEYNVTAKAIDIFGYEDSAAITVTVDNTLPTVTIIQPTSEGVYSGTIQVVARATDSHEIAVVYVKFSNTTWELMTYNTTTDLWYYLLNPAAFSDQQHFLQIQAVDKAGNLNIAPTTVFTDNNPPVVAVQSPSNGAVISSTVKIAVQADDASGISKVEFYLQDMLVYTVDKTPYQWVWNTETSSNGNYTIVVKAYDFANHNQTTSLKVTVKNTEFSWLQIDFHILLVAGVSAIIVTLIIVYYLKRKRKT